MTARTIAGSLIALLVAGCASLAGVKEQFVVCPYDQVWDGALEAVKDRSVVTKDKARGVIQTAWMEIPMPGRAFGAFRREMQDSKDRSRLKLDLKRMNDVTMVSIVEEREAWAWRGGARMFGWVPTDPSPEVMASVQQRIDAKLKERGCSPT